MGSLVDHKYAFFGSAANLSMADKELAFYGSPDVGTAYDIANFGAKGDGGDDSAAVTATIAAASLGASGNNQSKTVIQVPPGNFSVNPGTWALVRKFHIIGAGSDSSWFTLRSDPGVGNAALSLVIPMGAGVIHEYGTRIKGIGINLANAPNATGIRIGAAGGNGLNSNWAWLDDVRVEGGKVSLDVQSVNTKVTNCHFLNPTVSFITIPAAGQEFRFYSSVLEVGPGVIVPIGIDVPILAGGAAGAVYLNQIELNNSGTVNKGIYLHAPNGVTASVPLRAIGVTLDNLSGPGLDLENVSDCQWIGGWINSGTVGAHGAIRFFGGGEHTIIGVQQLNGGSVGCSYDFAGGSTSGVTLVGNKPSTGPVYKLSGANKPVELFIQDRIASVALIENVTNDPEGLRGACTTRLWTPQARAQRPFVRETGTNPPAGYATLVAGAVIVAHTGISAGTRVKLSRERPGGNTGQIYCSVADNVVGTSFKIQSTNVLDTSSVYWEISDSF